MVLRAKRKYIRGYAVGVLVGLDVEGAVFWVVYSHVVKPYRRVNFEEFSSQSKGQYNFFEALIDVLRPIIKEGLGSVILVSPSKTVYAERFLEHINSHHSWLCQGSKRVVFSKLRGNATSLSQVHALTQSLEFRKIVEQTSFLETENLVEILDRRLRLEGDRVYVLYAFWEVEAAVYAKDNSACDVEYVFLTNRYMESFRFKPRLNRLLQIASNRKIKTRIVDAKSPAGKRIEQLGGMVGLKKIC